MLQLRTDSLSPTDDTRTTVQEISDPMTVIESAPLNQSDSESIIESRRRAVEIIHGRDDRLLVITGPCSIHDPIAAMEYARWLVERKEEFKGELEIIMRVYFEKPRTTIGWKGLINDPHLDGSNLIEEGLLKARTLLRDIVQLGLPVAVEFLDVISPQYIGDLVTWGAIGARTTESQVHRELASGLSVPVGFKNGTDGNLQIAIDAIQSAGSPHTFLGVSKIGYTAVVNSQGNPDTHIVLRGGTKGPNYDANSIQETVAALQKGGANPHVVVDLSHANSQKNYKNQPIVGANVAEQIAGGNTNIVGVMIESNLIEGAQKHTSGQTDPKSLVYGQSITDSCIGLDDTANLLSLLASAAQRRRIIHSLI